MLQDIVAELGDVVHAELASVSVHGLRAHPDGSFDVADAPKDRSIDQHDNVVSAGCFDASQFVRLNLCGNKLLELPVFMRQQVDGAAVEDDLTSVILSHGHVTLINCEKCPRTKCDHSLVQANESLEFQHGGPPLVKSRWQQNWLSAFGTIPNESLWDGNNRTVSVSDMRRRVVLQRSRAEERILDTVHAGTVKEEVASSIGDFSEMAIWNAEHFPAATEGQWATD